MAKISNPISFSRAFDLSIEALLDLGVLDVTLNVDTKLFIDPLLLKDSRHLEMSVGAVGTFNDHFGRVIKLLGASTARGDVAWRNAERLLSFPEIGGTCLGFGSSSDAGSGSGAFTRGAVMQTAAEIVRLGVEDPDLFVSLALLEEGIGPDRISDMTTNVIFPNLLDFNARVLEALGVVSETFQIKLANGRYYDARLASNPTLTKRGPVVLVPGDVLRELPIVNDWSDVSEAAAKNAHLRSRVNDQIADIWRLKTVKDKVALRSWAMTDRESFETFLELLKGASAQPYDIAGDPLGELVWRGIAEEISVREPFHMDSAPTKDLAGVRVVVESILAQFRFLVEDRRLSEELYHGGKIRPEKSAQRLFFAIAYAYCKANNIDVTPEAETGNGPVDFKLATGFDRRVLVEIKLSSNPKVIAGYRKQIERYKAGEETDEGYYLVIDVGGLGTKDQELVSIRNDAAKSGIRMSELVFVDGKRRQSASKL